MFALIEFVLILVLAIVFIIVNGNATCDVTFFKEFRNVHVYITSLVSFTLGFVAAAPFFLFFILKKLKKNKEEKLAQETKEENEEKKELESEPAAE